MGIRCYHLYYFSSVLIFLAIIHWIFFDFSLLCSYLVGEKRGFVRPIRVGISTPSQRFHMRHGHSQDGKFVWFAGQCAAGRHHVGQFRDVGRHLVPPAPLDLAVVLSEERRRGREADMEPREI